MGGNLIVRYGHAEQEIVKLALELKAGAVLVNHDYEPQANLRDAQIKQQLAQFDCTFLSFKDQVILKR